MRLFIAIMLDDEMKRPVLRLQDRLRRQHVGGAYTPGENLHLTLAFIGEYGDADAVLECMGAVRFPAFRIGTEGSGSFGDSVWIGLRESRELEALAGQLRRALAQGGIPFDRKRFRPHITVLRRPVTEKGRELRLSAEPASMRVDHISLMRSTRGKNGMIYTELGRIDADDRKAGGDHGERRTE